MSGSLFHEFTGNYKFFSRQTNRMMRSRGSMTFGKFLNHQSSLSARLDKVSSGTFTRGSGTTASGWP